MSTRVLPVYGFQSYFNRMSELRRRLQTSVPEPSSAEQQAVQHRTVRRNLFGPIDHEENLKFVHEELSKISQADNRRWNFDFKKEKPGEGRYSWEETKKGKVPVAYEMPNLTAKLTLPNPLPSTSKITNVTSSITHQSTRPTVTNKPSTSSTSLELSLKTVSSATTTVLSAKPRISTSILSIPSLPENIISPVSFVDSGRISQVLSKSSIVRPSIVKQPKITEFLKIGKRTHSSSEEKRESEDAPPALKRARTSS